MVGRCAAMGRCVRHSGDGKLLAARERRRRVTRLARIVRVLELISYCFSLCFVFDSISL